MAKFVIECPSCGKYAEAKSGFFAKKRIDCACGHVINVRTEKLSSRKCSHCGNEVVFDQSKGDKAKCPVCHEPINTLAQQNQTVEFSCKQCGIRLRSSKAAATYTCPVCDCVNDVAERSVSEEIRKEGLASVIKYEGDNETLVWKHPVEDFNCGSQLIVHESQEAIFFRDGQALDLFGAGRYTLETQQLPILEKLYKLPTDPDRTFHSEVYYINQTTQMGIKWGTDTKVRLFDPMTGMHVEIGASGEFSIRVSNSRKFLLKVVGTAGGFNQEQLMGNNSKGYFRAMIMTQVKSSLAATIREQSISILEIDERLMELSEGLREKINLRLADFGLEMPEFYIVRVLLPEDDKDFNRARKQFAEQYLGTREEQIRKKIALEEAERKAVEAQTAARMKVIGAQGDAEAEKIKAAAAAEAYRMQAAAEAEEMRMKGYTYQQETARKVGMEAMQNGITGNGSSGELGSLVGLGLSLGTMGTVVGMAKDALNPVMEDATKMGQSIGSTVSGGVTWDCECGNKGITLPFCGQCGAKKPEPKQEDTWDCECGNKGITMKFCGQCGAKRPEPKQPDTWDCACGNKGITMKFCGQCGAKRPEPKQPDTWDCACGNKGITMKFCGQCGAVRPEPKPATWDCTCGQKAIETGFCPNCGNKKE